MTESGLCTPTKSSQGLVVDGISISFGGVQALKNVSFEVRPGEIVGLIGPNGAGKTSLINCVSRYYQPSGGRIEYQGQDLLKKKPHHLSALGISRSFQELNLPPALSVLDAVMLGLHAQTKTSLARAILDFSYLKNEDRKYSRLARNIMRFFADVRARSERSQEELGYPDINGKSGFPDLLDVQNVPVGMLPYGIKKKVDLARAFVTQPELLLLDEPAGGFGTGELRELKLLIQGARDEFNASVLLVEHQMPLVMGLCDRLVVLDFGEKIAEGTPAEVRENPKVIEAYFGKKGGALTPPRIYSIPSVDQPAKAERPILEVKGVDLHYGALKALSGISMKLQDRVITTVLGSNGAGKSSLMRAISGVERLSSGEILYQGERINHFLQKPRPDQIVRHGLIQVAEGRRIFKELSIMENLRIAGFTLKDRAKTARNIQKVFQYFPVLKEKLNLKDAGNLSGGQQQMLAIGMALIMEPNLLLLDEPSLGLSPVLVQELFEIIQTISRQEDCAVLLVEQNAEMALKVSAYAYILETGFIVKAGDSQEFINDQDVRKMYFGS